MLLVLATIYLAPISGDNFFKWDLGQLTVNIPRCRDALSAPLHGSLFLTVAHLGKFPRTLRVCARIISVWLHLQNATHRYISVSASSVLSFTLFDNFILYGGFNCCIWLTRMDPYCKVLKDYSYPKVRPFLPTVVGFTVGWRANIDT